MLLTKFDVVLFLQPAVQHTQTVTGVGQTGVQKSITVTTPLITSLTQSQVSSARLQVSYVSINFTTGYICVCFSALLLKLFKQ